MNNLSTTLPGFAERIELAVRLVAGLLGELTARG
jgi:hypothetical protein